MPKESVQKKRGNGQRVQSDKGEQSSEKYTCAGSSANTTCASRAETTNRSRFLSVWHEADQWLESIESILQCGFESVREFLESLCERLLPRREACTTAYTTRYRDSVDGRPP